MTDKITGKIIKIDRKGWGFITSEEIKFTKFFFHWTALEQSSKKFLELNTGMEVKFIPIDLEKPIDDKDIERYRGPRAIKVEVINLKENQNALDTEFQK